MNCPLCEAPLDEFGVCPNCGKVKRERTDLPGIYYDSWEESQQVVVEEEAPKKKRREPFFTSVEKRAIAGCFLLLLLFIGLMAWGASQYDANSVAVTGEGISIKNRDFVVYYEMALQNFRSSTEDAYFDPEKPLHKQYYNLDAGFTWDDYFKQQALSSAALTTSLVMDAEAAGFTLPQSQLDTLDAEQEAMRQQALKGGGTPDHYLATNIGEHISWESYWQYRRDVALAQAYANTLFLSYTYSEDELISHYKSNSDTYANLYQSPVPNVDLRHILLIPGSNSVEDCLVALEAAEAILLQCQEDTLHPEETFQNLAKEYSQDTGSSENGGLLQNIAPGDLSTAITGWCFGEEGREVGDMAVLPSNYGYHVVYFAGYRENYEWKDQVLSDLRNEATGEYVQALMEKADCKLTRFASH